MAKFCTSPPPSIDNAFGYEKFQAKLKRSPRCMQIDLLPLIASDMTMAKTAGSNRSNSKNSPAIWDAKLHLWTRNGTSLPSMQNDHVAPSLEEHLQPISKHVKEPILLGHTNLDQESSDDMHFLTMSTLNESFSHVNILGATGKAWLSSILDVPNDVITPLAKWAEDDSYREETSQLLVGVESLSPNLDSWDAAKQKGNESEQLSNYRSASLKDCQQYITLMIKGEDGEECTRMTLVIKAEEDEECTKIHENYFVEPQANNPPKPCPAFISPWFHSKPHQFSDSGEALNSSPNGSLDWTGDETIDGDDRQGFDGLGLRRQSENSRVRSRQFWNGDNQNGPRRNVRQIVQTVHGNIIDSEFIDNYDGFEPGDNLTKWFPQPGDIMVTKRSRHGDHLSPGGHVTLYKDEEFFFFTGEARELRSTQYDFRNGDFVVRLGKFMEDWIWHPSPSIEAFLCDLRQVRPWWLVARTYNNDLQPPDYQFDAFRSPVNSVDRTFCPRNGDLVVRAVPGEYNWGLYWWNHYFNFSPCDLVLRVGYEIRANGTCMVVEMFYREQDDRDWSFRGRDVWTYLSQFHHLH